MIDPHVGQVVRSYRSDVAAWRQAVVDRLAGDRLAGLYCAHSEQADTAQIYALVGSATRIDCLGCELAADEQGILTYRSLTPEIPAAFWYERALHDLSGVTPTGHPRLEPLLLPPVENAAAPLPGAGSHIEIQLTAVDEFGPVDVEGEGIFALPFGPVRSGVFESIEFLIESPGENIPYLTIRPHYKHRGMAKRFEGLPPADAVLVAERVEGISTIAHALAFSHAVEAAAGVRPPEYARLSRVIYAELERIANHLDVATRLSEAAGLAVAQSRLGWHKETAMRLMSSLCGSRFGRSVIVPGGVAKPLELDPEHVASAAGILGARVGADMRALLDDASFLDRLRATGVLDESLAKQHGTLGPIGRASACNNDCRQQRPYDGYLDLPPVVPSIDRAGDAMARLAVRRHEMAASFQLIVQAADRLQSNHLSRGDRRPSIEMDGLRDGVFLGWAEAAQGEVLYALHLQGGVVQRCFARSPGLHNLLLFRHVFRTDIFTDFPFIEASFGLSYAGVAM
ncbi:NADH-quinone oxidoreductase subunit D [Jongsikchunia kroppenstedtii]|uniref:NADH-quinone oxidoreductase subunit D n=1 Tax=Jongsikchunia kroppenstedtii TaxID=1121721 RepID=UPI000370831C|nr:NADH-quinone oxidoreductase subunit D [Jongsikchunia kroppenstedtii]